MKSRAIYIVLLIAAISLFFVYEVIQLQFKYDFELFHPKNDVNTDFFHEFRNTFESDNDFIQIGIVNREGVFNRDFLTSIDSLTSLLEDLAEVENVYSITNYQEQRLLPLYPGIFRRKVLRINNEEGYSKDSLNLIQRNEVKNFLLSEKGFRTCIYIQHTERLSEDGCFQISDQIDQSVSQFEFDESHISGRCVGLTTYVRLIKNEVNIFVGSSALLILLFLFLSYRSWWGVWMPSIVIGIAVLWTLGVMSLNGKPMDLISNVIPTMLLVIGISDVVHLLTRFLEHLRSGIDKKLALKQSIKEVGVATIFTSFTTSIGFLSLTMSQVQPVIDLGIYMSIGLLFAFLLSYTLFPSLIILNKNIQAQAKREFWGPHLIKLSSFIKKNSKWVLVVSAIIVLLSIPGVMNLKVNSFLQDGMQPDHPQRQAFQFFEEHFSGSRPLELTLNFPEGDLNQITMDELMIVEKIQLFLSEKWHVGNFGSISEIYKKTNQIKNGGDLKFYKLPSNESELASLTKLIERSSQSDMEKYLSTEKNTLRIQGKLGDIGSIQIKKLQSDFQTFVKSNYLENIVYNFTGAAAMMDNTHHLIVRNVVKGLFYAFAIIAIIMGIVFKSTTIVLILMLVNVIPLFITAGLMGFAGVNLQLSTSLILIIAFGIAVDDSIHFLTKFKFEITKGETVKDAIETTFKTTGKAIVVTTLIVSGGFLTLSMSDFLGTHYLGLYISLTLFIAMLIDLILLPTMLLLFYKRK